MANHYRHTYSMVTNPDSQRHHIIHIKELFEIKKNNNEGSSFSLARIFLVTIRPKISAALHINKAFEDTMGGIPGAFSAEKAH